MSASVYHQPLVPTVSAPGSHGEPVKLQSNFYKLEFGSMEFILYRIKLASNSLEKSVGHLSGVESRCQIENYYLKHHGKEIVALLKQAYPEIFAGVKYIHNGERDIITCTPLKTTEEKLYIQFDDHELCLLLVEADRFSSQLINDYYANKRAELSHRVIKTYEIFFRFLMQGQYEEFHHRFFFDDPQACQDKMRITQYVSGFINSVRPTQFGLALNVHLKTCVKLNERFKSVLDVYKFVADKEGEKKTNLEILNVVNRYVRKSKVFIDIEATRFNKVIDGLLTQTPNKVFFHHPTTDEKMSMAEFYRHEYHFECDPSLPMVRCFGSLDVNVSTRIFPLELVKLVASGKFLGTEVMDKQERQDMIKSARNTPQDYFSKVGAFVKEVASIKSDYYDEYKLKLSSKPAQINGRVLPVPVTLKGIRQPFLCTSDNVVEVAIFGLTNKAELYENALKQFSGCLLSMARNFGLNALKVVIVQTINPTSVDNLRVWLAKLKQLYPSLGMVFVGMPKGKYCFWNSNYHTNICLHPTAHTFPLNTIYSSIKFFCERDHGLLSQCFYLKHIENFPLNMPKSFVENLLLKVNAKFGGINNRLKPGQLSDIKNFDPSNTMIIGLDVNHPSLNEVEVRTSVAAAVGTLDANFTQYATSIRVQKKEKIEIVDQIGDMVEQLLGEYYQVNGCYPQNIILFRDGVGFSQYDLVSSIEISRVLAVMNKLMGHGTAKLTCLVVQKNHRTRFIRTEPAVDELETTTLNVACGTVVDTGIVEPDRHVFYLNSHIAASGISKPTKYIVLLNQSGFTNDDLQRLVFALCVASVRSLGSISIPVPVLYADLAAYRAKKHLEAVYYKVDAKAENDGANSMQELAKMLPEELGKLISLKPGLKNQLYFC